MCTESSQNDESRAQSADSSKATARVAYFSNCIKGQEESVCSSGRKNWI